MCRTNQTVVEHAGFTELYEASQADAGSKGEALAAVPTDVSHFSLDALFERPVQSTLVELLLLEIDDDAFTSCVVVHGMGGTGKTVHGTLKARFIANESSVFLS